MTNPSPATDAAAAFLADIDYDDIPDNVRETAVWILVDSIACAVAGATIPAGKRLLERYRDGGSGWITGKDRPIQDVAAANAQAANVLDYDTTYQNIGHPGPIAACTALTAGARRQASGAKVLTALVAGYELAARVGEALQPSDDRRERVWPWASWHVFAAAGAAAVLDDQEEATCRQTVNLAAGTAPISMVNRILEVPSTVVKNSNLWVTRSGVEAAGLADRGIGGHPRALDGPDGFHTAAGSDRWRPNLVVNRLESPEDWAITEASFKPYPICRWTHSCVDAAYRLREESVDSKSASAVEVETIPRLARDPHDHVPESHAEATWSVQWGVGCALTGIPPGGAWYEIDRFDDLELRRLMDLIEVVPNEDYGERFPDEIPATVQVRNTEGVFSAMVERPTGSPESPLTEADRREKAERLLESGSTAAPPADIVDTGLNVVELSDVRTLVKRL